MHETVSKAISSLEGWKTLLKQHVAAPNTPLNRTYGWNMPSLTRADIEIKIDRVIEKLRLLPDAIDGSLLAELQETPERTDWITANVFPNFSGGNAIWVIQQIDDELGRLDAAMVEDAPYDWEKLASDGYLPRKLVARLRALEARLADAEPRSANLDEKIKLIEDATASAEQLPTDLATLAEGRRKAEASVTEAQGAAIGSAAALKQSNEALSAVQAVRNDAEKLFERLDQIYKAGSTKGLASAFAAKAKGLNISLYFWLSVLMVDLAVGAWLGAERFRVLQNILQQKVEPTAFWANFVFSLISVAGPIWLGWVATKQISQRFKLAEDYSFKASIATAYEGYRSEAVRLDPAFEKRLFGSALDRLDEAPLRFVDTENFGTPWHELTSSAAFTRALEIIPDLKGTVAKIIAGAGGAAGGAAAMLKGLADVEKASEKTEKDDAQ